MKIDLRIIALKITEYNKTLRGKSELRLGQFLMNELCKTESNPDVFYEKDDKMAVLKFVETYADVEGTNG